MLLWLKGGAPAKDSEVERGFGLTEKRNRDGRQ